MNISEEVWNAAKERGLDWTCTGGGCDYIHREIQFHDRRCELTLSHHGLSPDNLSDDCEVGVSFHSPGYIAVGIPFSSVIDALDFMAKTKGVYFLPEIYERGKSQAEAEAKG